MSNSCLGSPLFKRSTGWNKGILVCVLRIWTESLPTHWSLVRNSATSGFGFGGFRGQIFLPGSHWKSSETFHPWLWRLDWGIFWSGSSGCSVLCLVGLKTEILFGLGCKTRSVCSSGQKLGNSCEEFIVSVWEILSVSLSFSLPVQPHEAGPVQSNLNWFTSVCTRQRSLRVYSKACSNIDCLRGKNIFWLTKTRIISIRGQSLKEERKGIIDPEFS